MIVDCLISKMEASKLSDIPNHFSQCGVTLDLETSELLKYSLIILQNENHFDKCYYWGRIDGIHEDYHVSFGYKKDCFCHKYYYSTNCIEWFLMPKVEKNVKILVPLIIKNFEGDPSTVLTVDNDNFHLSFINQDSELQTLLPNILKEEDRLAAVVESIRDEAMIVPRGAWYKCPNGSVIENPTFEGLSLLEASDLKSYVHGRPPLLKWNTNLLTRPDYNYSLDFLDTIDLDVPLGCWSLKFDSRDQLVTLQSLYWLGLSFYHKLNTPSYGSLYIGQGKKNISTPFML